ncbi:MAG TPA: XRE family transcriptional regulator [Sulfurimonas autotrophica]|nr:XRE family transcriptional regulator [Sulfurimonas autotrophica]
MVEIVEFTESELVDFYKKIGQNVKKYREEKGITQMELAHAIGHNSVGHIAKAEINKYGKHFSLEHIYKIAKILGIKTSQLIDE